MNFYLRFKIEKILKENNDSNIKHYSVEEDNNIDYFVNVDFLSLEVKNGKEIKD